MRMANKKVRVSNCCKAEIEYGGGGYDGEDIMPVTESCGKCGQLLAVNGNKSSYIRSTHTGRRLKNAFAYIFRQNPKSLPNEQEEK